MDTTAFTLSQENKLPIVVLIWIKETYWKFVKENSSKYIIEWLDCLTV
jgi:uridylate kinase